MRLACAVLLFLPLTLSAADLKGKVQFGGLPVPGATVTATQGDRTLTAITGPQGDYTLPNIPDGVWSFQVEMLGFASIKQQVTITAGAGAPEWDLKLLSFDEIKAMAGPPPPPEPPRISVTAPPETPQKPSKSRNKKSAAAASQENPRDSFQRTAVNANPAASADAAPPADNSAANQNPNELNDRASDGLLINGSENNGASSPFAQAASFGNNRRGPGSLYNGGLGFILDNSATDARSYSFTGQDTPKPAYNRMTGVANFGGPLNIPHLIRNGPIFLIFYQWQRDRTATTTPALMPTPAERAGNFSLAPTIYDPLTGAPFPGNVIPASRISPQAASLLSFYPLPNFAGSNRYNFQVPIVGATHQDSLQTRLNKNVGNRNQFYGTLTFQRSATDSPTVFDFLDKSYSLGLNAQANWTHRFSQRMFVHFGLQYTRYDTQTTPFFANRENVSGQAGITGNNQDPANWGPPTLSFASGIASLTDGIAANNRNQTMAFTYDSLWTYGRHNISYGGDFKRLEFNYLTQQNPRGTFTFTGAETGPPGASNPLLGSDFAGFLLGLPDTSQIAYGNADKYMRESQYDAFITDDWRIGPSLTVNAGVRWEYASPMTELYGRLVNLDITPGFGAAAPVVATNPTGPLTNQRYPSSLFQPDKHAFQPRVGVAWRPIPASSLVVRAGYGVYYNTSIYQSIALQMAQQAPLSRSLSVQNSAANRLTLANGFYAPPGALTNTFAIDPNFRIGYAQNWQLSVQRDLPGSLVMTATYLGIKGSRGPQEFLPNTYPEGAANPCPSCPAGFIYMASNGNSTRESGSFQLRRRLHSGFTASATYTLSKSIDDSALGGRGQGNNVIAQNWLDLSAERALSNFDQRQLLAFQMQYTTGQGIAGGTLLNGWRGTLFKEWTVSTIVNAGSGLPLTPQVLSAVSGTGVTGPVRPDYTGAPLYAAPTGLFLNPAAYTLAPPGEWGNAGRNSITGPAQFSLNAALARTFRLRDRYSLDLRVDATNLLNTVVFTSWETIVNSPQFGIPSAANAMRSLQTTLRLRF